jgi:hypothetical protein
MARIARRAVSANWRARADRRAIVRTKRVAALGAQRAQLAQAEEFVIASMRFDVIGNRRRRHVAALKAQSA